MILFVCNRGDIILYHGGLQAREARPIRFKCDNFIWLWSMFALVTCCIYQTANAVLTIQQLLTPYPSVFYFSKIKYRWIVHYNGCCRVSGSFLERWIVIAWAFKKPLLHWFQKNLHVLRFSIYRQESGITKPCEIIIHKCHKVVNINTSL